MWFNTFFVCPSEKTEVDELALHKQPPCVGQEQQHQPSVAIPRVGSNSSLDLPGFRVVTRRSADSGTFDKASISSESAGSGGGATTSSLRHRMRALSGRQTTPIASGHLKTPNAACGRHSTSPNASPHQNIAAVLQTLTPKLNTYSSAKQTKAAGSGLSNGFASHDATSGSDVCTTSSEPAVLIPNG